MLSILTSKSKSKWTTAVFKVAGRLVPLKNSITVKYHDLKPNRYYLDLSHTGLYSTTA